MKILITGANGFVGKQLTTLLESRGFQLLLATRKDIQADSPVVSIGDIDSFDNWAGLLSGVDIVIHLAARVHQIDENDRAATYYQRTNVDVTRRLAAAAIKYGVKRFIFLSTIKVNGEETLNGDTFSATDIPSPKDAYSKSKLEAEQVLKKLSSDSGMGFVIIRPPLVYGPGVKANFLRLLTLARGTMPLPFAGLNNSRDMVSLDNLCDLIIHCIDKPSASGKTFLVSDGLAYSTAEIITMARYVLGLPPRLFYCPPIFLKSLLVLVGKKAMAARLLGSLEIDISDTVTTLDWAPKSTLEQTLRKMLL